MPLTDAMLTFHYDNAMERVLRIMTMERELGSGCCSSPDLKFQLGMAASVYQEPYDESFSR